MSDDFILHDLEWTDYTENEPLEECAICGYGFSAVFEGIVCPDCTLAEANNEIEPTEEELAEWAQMLEEESEWARALMEEACSIE